MIFMYGSHLDTYRNARSTQYKRTPKAFRKYIENIITSSPSLIKEIDDIYIEGEYKIEKEKDIVLPYLFLPMLCSNVNCVAHTTSGCHVQSTTAKRRPIVIVPLCSSCNQNPNLEFKLRTGVPLMHKYQSLFKESPLKIFKLYFPSISKNKPMITREIKLYPYDY